MIPIRTDSPLRNNPYMNWALIAANVLVYIITAPIAAHHPHFTDAYGLSDSQPRLYQFFTYQFLHANALHIGGNMLFLYIFGNNINDRIGNLGYLALYLGGGVFAGISYVITSSQGGVPMIGASGAIASITGSYLVLLPRSNITVLVIYFYIGMYEIPSLWLIAAFFVLDVYYNFSQPDGVAHIAHIGGTMYGLLMCTVMLTFHLLPRDQFDIVSLAHRWNRRRQYRDMVASGYNPFEYTQPQGRFGAAVEPPRPPDARTARMLEIRAEIADALAVHDSDKASKLYLDLMDMDSRQVLPRQQQLDVANHLAGQQLHPQAALAYEAFLRQYPKSDQVAQVELMLGLIFARYLNEPARARDYLTRATTNYHAGRELELAKEELSRLPTAGA